MLFNLVNIKCNDSIDRWSQIEDILENLLNQYYIAFDY
jgi:hypothetical protein